MKTLLALSVKGKGGRTKGDEGGMGRVLHITTESKARRTNPIFWNLWSPNPIQCPRELV